MVHTFLYNHKGVPLYFLWDIESGSLHNVDYTAFLCTKVRYGKELSTEEQAAYNAISADDLAEISAELKTLEDEGSLNAKPQITNFTKNAGFIKAMCLHICHDCNMRCEYCFASGGTYKTARDYMTPEIGKKAIDFLIAHSGGRHNLEVDFFGGEPLLNMDCVKQIVSYAEERAKQENKSFSFTMTTNCVALDKENIDYLNEKMDNVVLSIDGRKEVHNSARKLRGGGDAYELILHNAQAFRAVRGNKRYYVRGTFTAKNLDFSRDVFDLNDKGFDQISVEPVVLPKEHKMALSEADLPKLIEEYDKLAEGYLERRQTEKWFNFFHFMIDLEHGPCINKRLTGCGAGTEYLAVSPIGELYPCHQFVSEKEYYIGNVWEGITHQEVRDRFAKVTVINKPHCKDCPAKYYCGGGCSANAKNFAGAIDGQYKMGCELSRKRMELSLAIAFIEQTEQR